MLSQPTSRYLCRRRRVTGKGRRKATAVNRATTASPPVTRSRHPCLPCSVKPKARRLLRLWKRLAGNRITSRILCRRRARRCGPGADPLPVYRLNWQRAEIGIISAIGMEGWLAEEIFPPT